MKIERINHDGEGVGYLNNKVSFVPKTIPGDEVLATIIKEYKNYNKCKLDKIIAESSDRVDYPCKYYLDCGGCSIGNYEYNKQLEFKKDKVKNIFSKYLNVSINPDIIPSRQYGYRNKITLRVDKKLGLLENESNDIVNIDKCLLVSDRVNEIISLLNSYNISELDSVIIREFDNGIMVGLYGSINDEVITKLKEYVISIYLNDKELYKKEDGYIILNGIKYLISLNSFFQVNTSNITNLYDLVIKYGKFSKEDSVLDLYCGLGSISLYISKYCKSVLGIEINESSINDANKNMKINNIINTKFICSDVAKIIDENYHYDVVVVDPPRSGLDNYTKDVLKKINCKRIVYVSCNPMTLVRDIRDMSDTYEFKDISLVDMFPNTHHIECVCLLTLKN